MQCNTDVYDSYIIEAENIKCLFDIYFFFIGSVYTDYEDSLNFLFSHFIFRFSPTLSFTADNKLNQLLLFTC